jgi:hypothetical protein
MTEDVAAAPAPEEENGPKIEPGADFSAAIYGAILVTALILALSHAEHDAGVLALTVLTTMAVFWLAHVWAAIVSERITRPRELSLRHTWELAKHEGPMLEAAIVPLLILLGAEVGIYDVDLAVTLSAAAGILNLFAWGLLLGRRNYDTFFEALVAGVITGLFGVGIVLLEVLIH